MCVCFQKKRRNEIRNLWLVCSLLPPTIYMYMDRPGLCLSLHYLHSSPPSLTQTYGLAKYTIRSFLLSLFSLLLHRFQLVRLKLSLVKIWIHFSDNPDWDFSRSVLARFKILPEAIVILIFPGKNPNSTGRISHPIGFWFVPWHMCVYIFRQWLNIKST